VKDPIKGAYVPIKVIQKKADKLKKTIDLAKLRVDTLGRTLGLEIGDARDYVAIGSSYINKKDPAKGGAKHLQSKGFECMKVLEHREKIYSVEYVRDCSGVPLYIVKIISDHGEEVVVSKYPDFAKSILKIIIEEDTMNSVAEADIRNLLAKIEKNSTEKLTPAGLEKIPKGGSLDLTRNKSQNQTSPDLQNVLPIGRPITIFNIENQRNFPTPSHRTPQKQNCVSKMAKKLSQGQNPVLKEREPSNMKIIHTKPTGDSNFLTDRTHKPTKSCYKQEGLLIDV
jgi:hypothetical protein